MQRLTTDEALDAQRALKAVSALTPSTHGLQLDLAGEEFPEHLARLSSVIAEERGHISYLFPQGALEMCAVQARDRGELFDLRQLGLECGLPGLLGAQAALNLVDGERVICHGVDQPVKLPLNGVLPILLLTARSLV